MSETYVKPELYLYIGKRTAGATTYIEAHIVKMVYDNWHNKTIAKCADGYDFSKDGSYRENRFFDNWSPNLRHYGAEYNFAEPEYTDVFSADLNKVEKMAKTLRSLKKALEKIAEKRGHSQNFIETIIRFGEVCGVVGVVTGDLDNGYKTFPMMDARWVIKNFFAETFKVEINAN